MTDDIDIAAAAAARWIGATDLARLKRLRRHLLEERREGFAVDVEDAWMEIRALREERARRMAGPAADGGADGAPPY